MIAMLAGPLAPLPRPTTSTTTMLSRMSVPSPTTSVAAPLAQAISSAPATRSLLPNPQGVNPQTLQAESGLTYTSKVYSPSRVADAVNPARASIFGRTGVDGGAAPSSPTPAASVGTWNGGSPPSGPAGNAMIPSAPAGRAPDPGAAAMLQTPSGGGGGGGGLPSMPSGDRASGPAPSSSSGGVPTIAIVGGVALLAIGAFVLMGRR